MLIKKPAEFKYSDVTPKHIYLNRPVNRRRFLGAGAAALGALALPPSSQAAALGNVNTGGRYHNLTDEMPSPKEAVTTYNNFYEFGTGKGDPSQNAPSWNVPEEWPIRIEGEVAAPKTLDLSEVMKLAPLEERIYRLRCVERWSVVVPWIGIPLSTLLSQVEPTGNAKYVAFESYYDPREMLSPRQAGIPFPYVEGLRMDEAMNPMAFLAVGVYGETLPNQNGAPIRLVVPWKYGFKSIKSIVRVRLVEEEPPTTWNIANAREYGFYSNVNPNRDHPRWSQEQEQRLGSGFLGQGERRNTEIFNGYGAQVSSLYDGMDLIRYY